MTAVPEIDPFDEAIAAAQFGAVHLELRDAYEPSDPSFVAFCGGPAFDRTKRDREWHALIRPAVERGVVVRRARVVSEPVTDFIRYEHAVTPQMNLAAGEVVRWLARRQASDLALPGNDFWLFDDRLVRFSFFSGVGDYLGEEWTSDPQVIKLCQGAFEAVWERATPHADYQV